MKSYKNERRIVRRILNGLFADGWAVYVHDGEELTPAVSPSKAINSIVWKRADGPDCWNLDEFWLVASKEGEKNQSVYFIPSNGNDGWDVITDYSVGLESVVGPVLEFADREAAR